MHESLLRVRDMRVVLGGKRVLDAVSFDVPAGLTTALIGPNGAGKSVLLRAILGLLPLAAGSVELLGMSPREVPRLAGQVSYVPQKLSLDVTFPLTVRGLFGLTARGFFRMRAADQTRMRELLSLVGMGEAERVRLATLSGGQLQRVLIAYSLMRKPRLLILDEPAAGIDVQGQETIYALLERIKREEQLTLLLVSHELDVVMQFADQVLCLNRELLCVGVPREVLTQDVLEQMYGAPVSHFHHDHGAH